MPPVVLRKCLFNYSLTKVIFFPQCSASKLEKLAILLLIKCLGVVKCPGTKEYLFLVNIYSEIHRKGLCREVLLRGRKKYKEHTHI